MRAITPATLLVVFILASALVAQRTTQRQVQLTFPDWALPATCSAFSDAKLTSQRTGREQEFDCSNATSDLRCDFGGAEPIDLPLAAVCRTGGLPLVRGRAVALKAQRPTSGDVLIEWLDSSSFPKLKLVATRQISSNDPLQIVIGTLQNRWLRFLQPGYSPLTVTASELFKDSTVNLRDRRPGGELLARLQDAPILPDFYRFRNLPVILGSDDVRGPNLQIRDGIVRVQGVPTGPHEIVPYYAGGLTGKPIPFVINSGRSSAVELRAERVGRAEIAASADLCGRTDSVRILRTIRASVDIVGTELVLRTPQNVDCRQTVAGLVPGDYEAAFDNNSGSIVRRSFVILDQEVTKLVVSTVEVSVRGRVLYNERPFSGALEFISTKSKAATLAPIDGSGSFDALLSEPGDFEVFLRSGRVRIIGQQKKAQFAAGSNAFDWSLTGGEVRIEISGWDRSVALELFLRRVAPLTTGSTAEAFRLRTDADVPVIINALGFGEYVLEGRESSQQRNRTKTARRVSFVLDDKSPKAEVRLDLADNTATVRVVDEAGLGIASADAFSSTGMARRLGAGILSLEDVSPGTPVQIRAPRFTPVCVMSPADGEVIARLERGRPVEVRLLGLPDSVVPVGTVTWTNSRCPVALEHFDHILLPSADGVRRFLIRNFPSVNNLGFAVTFPAMKIDIRDQVQVQPDGVLWIRIR